MSEEEMSLEEVMHRVRPFDWPLVNIEDLNNRKIAAKAVISVMGSEANVAEYLSKKSVEIVKELSKIEEKVGVEKGSYVKNIFKTTEKIGKEDAYGALNFAEESVETLNDVVELNKEYVPVVFNFIERSDESDSGIFYILISKACDVLEYGGVDTYKVFFDAVNKVASNNHRATIELLEWTKNIIGWIHEVEKTDEVNKGAYGKIVFEAVRKIGDKNGWRAYSLAYNSRDILKGMDKSKELTADYLLIESIRDQKDAQIISQVIDMDKYQDLYNEKVAKFY